MSNVSLTKFNEKALSALPVTTDDFNDYPCESAVLPFCKIRQKDLNDDSGTTINLKGSFCFNGLNIPDTKAIEGVVIGFNKCRVYFKQLEDSKPTCKSNDCKIGSKEEEIKDGVSYFSNCSSCSLSKWDGNKSPICKEGRNVLFLSDISPLPFIFTFTASGIKPWRNFFTEIQTYSKGSVPIHAFKVKLTLKFKSTPSDHYVPEFTILDVISKDEYIKINELRKSFLDQFSSQEIAYDSDDYGHHGEITDEKGIPVSNTNNDDDLPF